MKSIFFGCGQSGDLTCKHTNPTTESLKQIKSLLEHSQKSTDKTSDEVDYRIEIKNKALVFEKWYKESSKTDGFYIAETLVFKGLFAISQTSELVPQIRSFQD